MLINHLVEVNLGAFSGMFFVVHLSEGGIPQAFRSLLFILTGFGLQTLPHIAVDACITLDVHIICDDKSLIILLNSVVLVPVTMIIILRLEFLFHAYLIVGLDYPLLR